MRRGVEELPRMFHLTVRENAFFLMLFFSLLVHAAITAYLVSHKTMNGRSASITYIDLSLTRPAEPKAVAVAEQTAPRTVEPPPPLVPPAPTEFDRLQDKVREALETAAKEPEAVEKMSIGLGMTNGFFSSLSEGKTLRPEIREYYFALLRQVNEKWWIKKNGLSGWGNGALINVTIARNGALLYLEMIKSSGNPAWDRAMLQILEAASPLPPLPENYRDDTFRVPLRFVGPLNLLLPALDGTGKGAPHSDSSNSSSTRSRS